jgi:hypothetical protein
MARDVLAVPGAGTGVERLFSVARQQAAFTQDFSATTFEQRMVTHEANKTQDIITAHAYETELIGSTGCSAAELKEERLRREQEVEAMMRFDYISDTDERPIAERPQPVKRGYLNRAKRTRSISENVDSLQEERGEPATSNWKRRKAAVDDVFTIASDDDEEVAPVGDSS